jgi:hypothetical protein
LFGRGGVWVWVWVSDAGCKAGDTDVVTDSFAGEYRQGDHETTSRAGRSNRRGRAGRLDGAVDGDAAFFIHHEHGPENSIRGRVELVYVFTIYDMEMKIQR